jgi:hypothetical protein
MNLFGFSRRQRVDQSAEGRVSPAGLKALRDLGASLEKSLVEQTRAREAELGKVLEFMRNAPNGDPLLKAVCSALQVAPMKNPYLQICHSQRNPATWLILRPDGFLVISHAELYLQGAQSEKAQSPSLELVRVFPQLTMKVVMERLEAYASQGGGMPPKIAASSVSC